MLGRVVGTRSFGEEAVEGRGLVVTAADIRGLLAASQHWLLASGRGWPRCSYCCYGEIAGEDS